jgi:hypothetical protein
MGLQDISDQLNAAAETGDFERAIALAAQYRRRFDELWAARRDSSLPEQALLLHNRALARLVEARTAKAAELRGVKLARPYTRRSTAPEQWRMTL